MTRVGLVRFGLSSSRGFFFLKIIFLKPIPSNWGFCFGPSQPENQTNIPPNRYELARLGRWFAHLPTETTFISIKKGSSKSKRSILRIKLEQFSLLEVQLHKLSLFNQFSPTHHPTLLRKVAQVLVNLLHIYLSWEHLPLLCSRKMVAHLRTLILKLFPHFWILYESNCLFE